MQTAPERLIDDRPARAPRPAAKTGPGPVLSIVVPTFNERDNVRPFLRSIDRALKGVAWEVIFVDDDSPDGTATEVAAAARADRRVRFLHRIGRRGLASACVEGALSSPAPYVAIMDGDLQHDEQVLPRMLRRLHEEKLDLVVGSRYVEEGGVGDWSAGRARASRLATAIAERVAATGLSDPMSGFFIARREVFVETAPRLSSIGFKILLDLFASSARPLKFEEEPYEFRTRKRGDSKLDFLVLWEFAMLLADKSIGRYVPARLVGFSIVGGLGVFVHLATLASAQALGSGFLAGHIGATLVAMTFNFLLNNQLTYRDMRLKGRRLLTGWLSFVAACSIGAAANVGVAGYMFEHEQYWALSALAGVAVGTLWNFVVTSAFTWKARR